MTVSSTGQQRALVVAVLAGEGGDVVACSESVLDKGLAIRLFDTTPDRRHARRHDIDARAVVRDLPWPDDFATARNIAMGMLRDEFEDVSHVLWVDLDERLVSLPDDLALDTLTSGVGCPWIRDPDHDTQGVARLVPLRSGLHFVGLVHEYVEGPGGSPVAYEPVDLVIWHEGYSTRDRSERNVPLLRRQIHRDPTSGRWRPFLVRDGADVLTVDEIEDLNSQHIACVTSGRSIGGILPNEHVSMLARYSCLALILKGHATRADRVLRQHVATDLSTRSELLYLRLVAQVVADDVDVQTFSDALELRAEALAGSREQDLPWLDAVISHVLGMLGDDQEAEAYRQQSTSFTDEFFLDSRLRQST